MFTSVGGCTQYLKYKKPIQWQIQTRSSGQQASRGIWSPKCLSYHWASIRLSGSQSSMCQYVLCGNDYSYIILAFQYNVFILVLKLQCRHVCGDVQVWSAAGEVKKWLSCAGVGYLYAAKAAWDFPPSFSLSLIGSCEVMQGSMLMLNLCMPKLCARELC